MSNWTLTNGGWNFSTDRLHRNATAGYSNLPLINTGTSKTFFNNKTYVWKVSLFEIDDYQVSSALTLISPWVGGSSFSNGSYAIDNRIDTGGTQMESYPIPTGNIYLYSRPDTNVSSGQYLTFLATNTYRGLSGSPTSTPSSGQGIRSVDIYEQDFIVNGYTWIKQLNESPSGLSESPTLLAAKSRSSSGWSFISGGLSYNEYYRWFDVDDPTYFPRGINNISSNSYRNNNFITKYIPYSFFNLRFGYQKFIPTDPLTLLPTYPFDSNAGIRVYLSPTIPYSGTDENIFNNFLQNEAVLIAGLTATGATGVGLFGLSGNQYLIFVGDKAGTTSSTDVIITDIKIEGGYHESNNRQYVMSLPDITTTGLTGATFSNIIGNASTLDPQTLSNLSQISSKIGNGSFQSGIWENGVWNNGWRLDTGVKEFYDIDLYIKTLSDIKWRLRITGETQSVSHFNIGDEVSIGNIVAVDINNNRKIIKDSFKIVGKSINGINERIGFLIVELETTFPIMRIIRDSENHRIKITKNIWLSGVFLNGYFSGVWNYGLFRGYPLITEMRETSWIDGIFEGGHFTSRNYIFGTFSDTVYRNGKLGLTFSSKHRLIVGDIINIDKFDKTVNSTYDGETKVVDVLNDFEIITDLKFKQNTVLEGGNYYSYYSNGLIQNMNFDSKNISEVTSNESLNSGAVFVYNSWLDVIYSTQSAVNIGRRQTQINEISKRTYSENNLYGYPTGDILSSNSTFRDSHSLDFRTYKLGKKYQTYNDFIGDSSIFTEYFGPTGSEINLFIDQGWTFSVSDQKVLGFTPSILISRTDSTLQKLTGEELNVKSSNRGVVIDISTPNNQIRNRSLDKIEKDRYTIIEFDLVDYKSNDIWNLPTLSANDAFFYSSLDITDTLNREPVLDFNNINFVKRSVIQGTSSVVKSVRATYLPINENINHINTMGKRKIEYFFNKTNLSMNIKGSGAGGLHQTDISLNNLKIQEVDMIPFFQYFTEENINKSVQIPLQGISPFIDYSDVNFRFIDNVSIGLDSINANIEETNNLFSGVGIGVSGAVTLTGLLSGSNNTNQVTAGDQFFNSQQ